MVLLVRELDHQICHGLIEVFSHYSGAVRNEHSKVVQLRGVLIEILDVEDIGVTEADHVLHDIRIELV